MKKLLLLLISFPLIGMNHIDPKNLQIPSKLGSVKVFHDNDGIYVEREGKLHTIERHQCDTLLRKLIATKKLKEFQDADGYISIKPMGEENPELALTAKVRGLGGGPWLSLAVFGACQVGGYAALLTGAVVANAAAPGAGGIATAAALGTGGVPAYVTAVNLWALKCSAWAFALPTI